MHAVEHVASAPPQAVDHAADFRADLVRRSLGQHVLGVDAAPKCHAVTEAFLEHGGLHIGGGDLDRIESVDADIDQILDERRRRAATVIEHLVVALALDGLHQGGLFRLHQFAIDVGAEHRACLGRQIVTPEHDVDPVP